MMKTKHPLFQFLPYMKQAKRSYLLGFIFSLLNVGLGVAGVYILSKVFDGISGDLTQQIILKSLIEHTQRINVSTGIAFASIAGITLNCKAIR